MVCITMKPVVFVLLCLIPIAVGSSRKIAINTVNEFLVFDRTAKGLMSLARFNQFDTPKNVEQYMIKLDKFGEYLSDLALAFSSLRYLWRTSADNTQTRASLVQVLNFSLAIERDTPKDLLSAEKRVYNITAGAASKLESFVTPKTKLESMLSGSQTNVDKAVLLSAGKAPDFPLSLCDSASGATLAAELLNAYVDDVMPMSRWAVTTFMSELYDRLKKMPNKEETARNFAQLIMRRAITASFVAQLCVGEETYPMPESLALVSGSSAANQLKGIAKGLSALTSALQISNVGVTIYDTTNITLQFRQDRTAPKLNGVTDKEEIRQIYTKEFTNISKILWQSLNSSFGNDSSFSVHVVWKEKQHEIDGAEFTKFEVGPFFVYVHYTPRSREVAEIRRQFQQLYKTLRFGQQTCDKQTRETTKKHFQSIKPLEKALHDAVRVITDNKVPFMLIADEVYESFGDNYVYELTCVPFDVVIGV